MKEVNMQGCHWIIDCVNQATQENAENIGLREAMAYAEDAEYQMSLGNPPCFEVASFRTSSGHIEEFEVPEEYIEEAICCPDIILSNNIRSGSDSEYRAILKQQKEGDVLVIQQWVDDEWFPTPGQWYVSTLMEDPLRDKIYIDYGATWLISGMREALANVPKNYNRFVTFSERLASGA